MANNVVAIRKLFERRLERVQEEGVVLAEEAHGFWAGLGLYLVADALYSVSTSIDNLSSEVRDCNDGVAQALKDGLSDVETNLANLTDAVKERE